MESADDPNRAAYTPLRKWLRWLAAAFLFLLASAALVGFIFAGVSTRVILALAIVGSVGGGLWLLLGLKKAGAVSAVLLVALTAVAAMVALPIGHTTPDNDRTHPRGASPAPAGCGYLLKQASVQPAEDRAASAVEFAKVTYNLSGNTQLFIEIAARISGRPDRGNHLYVMRNDDPDTRDSTVRRNQGTENFFVGPEVIPNTNGCWRQNKRALGYSRFCGITAVYHFTLVSGDSASILERNRMNSKDKNKDGYTRGELRSLGVQFLATFDVPTKPCSA